MSFTALEPVKHDGKRYEPGDRVPLTEKEAQALLVSLAVVADPKAEPKPETKAKA